MARIVCVPHPVLRQITKPVERVDKKLLDLIEDMTQTLLSAKDPEGVGLAAPQVGEPLKLFLARPDLKKPPLLFINPEITQYSQRLQQPNAKNGVYEGCLSIPNHYSPIKRSQSVTVKYQDIDMTQPEPQLVEKTGVFTVFLAHIIQHETDHLNGILFVDHVLTQHSKLYLIKGEVYEEVTI